MKSGWIAGTCGLILGACLGYVAGNIAASGIQPLTFRTSTARPNGEAPRPLTLPAASAIPSPGVEADDGAVFFPEGALADFPASSTEAVHAAGESTAPGHFEDSPSATEPAELPEAADAAPLAESSDDPGLRRIVDHELPDLSEADREIWVDALRGLPREDIVGILRLWRKFGGTPASMLPGEPAFDIGTDDDAIGLRPEQNEVELPSPLVPDPPVSEGDATVAALLAARTIIINNLLNAETTGYRRREVLFAEAGPGPGGVAFLGVRVDHSPGKLVPTASRLDVGIDGPGFYVVADGEQLLFTRCGRFERDDDGRLTLRTTRGGLPLHPEVLVPDPLAAHDAERERPEGPPKAVAASIQLAMFADPGGLEPAGDGLYRATPASGAPQIAAPVSGTVLRPMCLERSNVEVRRERRLLRQVEQWLELVRSRRDE